uniref:Uncharacterized protein LOC114913162 n=1 Tax=Elaeis guineensis var. tenera TaxID=51953 RepID=A0A8N4IBB9_ELAGV|nr:uncharacterized protein LOC114913162 [Elaeis guineensis]
MVECHCSDSGDHRTKPLLGPWIWALRVPVVNVSSPSMQGKRSPTPPADVPPSTSSWSQPKRTSKNKSPPSSSGVDKSSGVLVIGSRFGPLSTVEQFTPPSCQPMDISSEPQQQKDKRKRSPPSGRGQSKSPGSDSPQHKVVVIEESDPVFSGSHSDSSQPVLKSHRTVTKKEVWRAVASSSAGSSSVHTSSSGKDSLVSSSASNSQHTQDEH